MRTLLMGAALLACTGTAMADMYRWVDGQGRVHYGDRAPAGKVKQRVASAPTPGMVARDLDIRPDQTLANECLDSWRQVLKDPRSAYLVEAKLQAVSNAGWHQQVWIDVSAKNGYGGANREQYTCPQDGFGHINPEWTRLVQMAR